MGSNCNPLKSETVRFAGAHWVGESELSKRKRRRPDHTDGGVAMRSLPVSFAHPYPLVDCKTPWQPADSTHL
jgi:hypothetical protein